MLSQDRLTVKAAEAINAAIELARKNGNPVIQDLHLLSALLDQDEGIVVPIIQKLGVNVTALREQIAREMARYPKQSGASPSTSRELNQVLDRADDEAKKLGDQFVSTEHMLLALADQKGTESKTLLSAAGAKYKALLEEKRVYPSKDVPWKGGPGQFGKSVISPQATSVVQSMESHIEAYAPSAYGQKHGHLNSAVFYVLKGRGHDVHDGRHIPWKAGDVMNVENGSVHQHFNDDPEEEAILLVFKANPLFLFMHLLFQKIVEWPPDTLPPGLEYYKPPADI